MLVTCYSQLNSFGELRALETRRVTDCEGKPLMLKGAKAELLRLHNEERAKAGAPGLCVHPRLQAAAQGHAEDMLARGFYDHVTPDGMDPGDRISAAGYPFVTYGENNNRVSGNTVSEPGIQEIREAMQGWMESPGHRKNLLDPAFQEVGFGISTGHYSPAPGNTTMYVANFGARG